MLTGYPTLNESESASGGQLQPEVARPGPSFGTPPPEHDRFVEGLRQGATFEFELGDARRSGRRGTGARKIGASPDGVLKRDNRRMNSHETRRKGNARG